MKRFKKNLSSNRLKATEKITWASLKQTLRKNVFRELNCKHQQQNFFEIKW
jgi:hypothetical protein